MIEYPDYYRKGMGTENVGPFLRSIIQMARPKKVLELGMGYTSLFLLEALEKNKELFDDGSGHLDQTYVKNHNKEYNPKFVVIDDKSFIDNEGSPEWSKIENELNKSEYTEIIEDRFQGNSQKLFNKYGTFDFVWFDCSNDTPELLDFMKEYWDICSGYVIFHFTHQFQKPNNTLGIITALATGNPQHIDILEPHKNYQGSITVLKKCPWETRKNIKEV